MKKKILKIMSIVTICFVMIFSMCSFTTTTLTPENYAVYESHTQCDISYWYYNQSNTSFYNGTIPSCNRILLDPTQTTLAGIRDSIKFQACDMFMGNSTKSIDIRSFSVSGVPSTLTRDSATDDLVLGISYRSDDVGYSMLGTTFTFWNFDYGDNIIIWPYDSGYNTYEPYDEYFTGYLTIDVALYSSENNQWLTESVTFEGTLQEMVDSMYQGYDFAVFNMNMIVSTTLERYGLEAERIYIPKVELSLTYKGPDGSHTGYGAVKVVSRVYEKTTDGYSFEDLKGYITEQYVKRMNLEQDYDYLSSLYEGVCAELESAQARIKELEDGESNNAAIPLLFDGIYKTIYNVLTIFFNMDFFGTKLGTVVGILLGAAIVILILKVVL